jgi:ribonuclease T2
MRSIAFVLSLAAILFVLNAASDYDYYVFATEWAGTVCRHQKCTQASGIDPNFFNIHGLWPSQHGQFNKPSDCDGPSFSDTYLSEETISGLGKYWSGLYNSAIRFHTHEWSKHGTCWNDDANTQVNAIEDFFQHVLSIAQIYNAHSILTQAGIRPGSIYPYQAIKKALTGVYGDQNSFTIQCQAGQLSGIEICLDKSYKPMKCPKTPANRCGNMIAYPPLVSSIFE